MPSFDSSVYKPLFVKTAYALVNDYRIAMTQIKNNGETKQPIEDLHRIVHSLKGQCAFMMFTKTAFFFKEMESLFLFMIHHPSIVSDSVISELPQPDFLLSCIKNIEEQNKDYDCTSEINSVQSLIGQLSEMKPI